MKALVYRVPYRVRVEDALGGPRWRPEAQRTDPHRNRSLEIPMRCTLAFDIPTVTARYSARVTHGSAGCAGVAARTNGGGITAVMSAVISNILNMRVFLILGRGRG
jgi:hypothetical protein